MGTPAGGRYEAHHPQRREGRRVHAGLCGAPCLRRAAVSRQEGRAMIRETIALAIGAAIFAGAFGVFLWIIL